MRISQLATDSIGLFLEYRDQHGMDEEQAKAAAVSEMVAGTFGYDANIELPPADEL